MKSLTWTCAVALLVSAGAVHAHGDKSHPAKPFDPARAEQQPFGIAGDPKQATRTMTIAMSDKMHFAPSVLTIRKGETVRFVVRNEGKLLHELVLGTEDELKKHAEEMRKFPDMEHDEPHMAHVAAGKPGEIGWRFTRPGTFHFGCLVPGHFEAGMVGTVTVR